MLIWCGNGPVAETLYGDEHAVAAHDAAYSAEAAAAAFAAGDALAEGRRGFRLPLYLKVPLLPLLGVEALLQRLANKLTARGFPSLSRKSS